MVTDTEGLTSAQGTNQSQTKLAFLRTILKTLGLSPEAVDDIVDRIVDFLSGSEDSKTTAQVYPYAVRDDFLSTAELSFYRVLRTCVDERILICPKVALGDLFYATVKDNSQWRIFTNKIDRKHVDFLLCNRQTMQPLAGIELDDSSHQRTAQKTRDEFIEGVFAAAALPLIRIPAQRGYAVNELRALLDEFSDVIPTAKIDPGEAVPSLEIESTIGATSVSPMPQSQLPGTPLFGGTPAKSLIAASVPIPESTVPRSSLPGVSLFDKAPPIAPEPAKPVCPKCGGTMLLRTAKNGPNQGEQFWGCSNYPKCHQVLQYDKGAG